MSASPSFAEQNIFILQGDFVVGALEKNCELLVKASKKIRKKSAGEKPLLVAGELALSGYPPQDLLLRRDFINATQAAIKTIAETAEAPLLFGAPYPENGKLYNAAVLVENGRAKLVGRKSILPNYGVFDEYRFFTPAAPSPPTELAAKTAVLICEDIWQPEPAAYAKSRGAEQIIVLNASPFEIGKPARRLAQAQARSRETELPLLYANLFGGQDEAVFDGRSFALNHRAELVYQAAAWRASIAPIGINNPEPPPEGFAAEEVYNALLVGLRQYMAKSNFRRALLGLSGGIDSAVTAAVAADAVGPENVHALIMPSPHTRHAALAEATAAALGIAAATLPIGELMRAFDRTLGKPLEGIAAENIQARIRAVLLMAESNRDGSLLLTTGNKSESAVGYTTLYGDMCGGFSLLKDVYKTQVYELARWRNRHRQAGFLGRKAFLISDEVLNLPPSAELKPGQLDEDTLPPYRLLDKMLYSLLEQNLDPKLTAEPELAAECLQMVLNSEYKRRQSAPGVKVSSCLLGWDRRYPIVNHFKG